MEIAKIKQVGSILFLLFWTLFVVMPASLQAAPQNETEAQAAYERLSLEKTNLENRIEAGDKILSIFPVAARKLSETYRGLQEIQVSAPVATDWQTLADLGKRLFDKTGVRTTLAKLEEEIDRLPKEVRPSKPAEDVVVIKKKIGALLALADRFSVTLAMDAAATQARLSKDKPDLLKIINTGGQSALMLLQIKTRYIMTETEPLLEQTKATDRSIDSLCRGLQANSKSDRARLAKIEGQIQYLLGNHPIKRKGEKKP
jgi:hypothetical protein